MATLRRILAFSFLLLASLHGEHVHQSEIHAHANRRASAAIGRK